MKKRLWILTLVCLASLFVFTACFGDSDEQTQGSENTSAIGTESVSESASETETTPESESASETETAPESESESETAPESESASDTESASESASESESESESSSESTSDSESKEEEDKLIFHTLQVSGTDVYGLVSNETTMFSLLQEITLSGKATYTVSLDILGVQEVVTKTVPLAIGDNTFYVLEKIGEDLKLYTVTIRRRPIYTLTFNTQGGTSVPSQSVEEGYLASEPTTSRNGYTFDSWSYDFAQPIMQSMTVTASWTANTYTVTFDENGGDTTHEDLTVTYYGSYTLPTPEKTGYTFLGWYDAEDHQIAQSGTWKIASDTTLKAKWQINRYTVTVNGDPAGGGTVSGGGAYDYGTSVTLTATPNLIYDFIGWYVGDARVSTDASYTFVLGAEHITVKAKWQVRADLADFTFTSTASTCTITGVKDTTKTSIVVPDYVTAISKGAFSGCTSLTSITLPFVGATKEGTSNTHFGYIFGASSYSYHDDYVPTSLKTVVITGGTRIGSSAFRDCSSLTSITISSSVTSIGDYAFYCCSLTSITIPSSVTSIGWRAFYKCSSLSSVTFGDNSQLTSIGEEAFYYCPKLSSVTFGENSQLTSIGNRAFYDCTSLSSITIPSSVTSIGNYAFYYCSSLSSVTFGENSKLKSIGSSAFRGCTSLSSITIPSSVTSIGDKAFEDCTSLSSITIPSSVTSIGEYAFYKCSSLSSVTIPSSVTSIGDGTFYGCSSLSSITIPSSVTSIGGYAFSDCDSLSSITIPSSVTSIGSYAFCSCSKLSSVMFGANSQLTSIGDRAFYYCRGLTSVTIPDSVTSIGEYAFYDCSKLSSVTFEDTEGWKAGSTALSSNSLASTSTAATYLRSTYHDCTWTKE